MIVSATPIIRADLAIASAYFGQAIPTNIVQVGTPPPAIGNNGAPVPAGWTVWAVTVGNTITIAPFAWHQRHQHPTAFCDLIVHETGHLLGFPDTLTIPMMDVNLANDHTAMCRNAPH